MEQRLPSVPSLQSDLLITRGSGGFISPSCKLTEVTHVRARALTKKSRRHLIPRGSLSSPCDRDLDSAAASYGTGKPEDGVIDWVKLNSTERGSRQTH